MAQTWPRRAWPARTRSLEAGADCKIRTERRQRERWREEEIGVFLQHPLRLPWRHRAAHRHLAMLRTGVIVTLQFA